MKNKFNKIFGIVFGIIMLFTSIIPLKAASASISVSSSSSRMIVGNTVTVTIKLSSGSALGTWEWTVDYDKNKLKLTSGESNVVGYGDGSKKSVSYTYKFKAISNGSAKVSVKSYSALSYSDKSEFSVSVSSKTISIITQAELEASYSKNNNLSSLGVEGYELTPSFNKDTTEYKVEVPANVESVNVTASKEDNSASINGAGTIEVAEGDNKIDIVVTAENGSTKTYSVIVTVKDENPIEVTIGSEKLTVVKRSSSLTSPENYEAKEITINDIKVPAFYSEVNDYYLVGLKSEAGEVKLYVYDEKNNTYTLYTETKVNQLLLQILTIEKSFENYVKSTIEIGDNNYECYKIKNSKYAIIYAKNLTNGKKDYYLYDSKNNTAISYTNEEAKIYQAKSEKYFQIILLLGAETAIVFLVLIIVLLSKLIKNKKKKKLIKETLIEKQKEEDKKEVIEEVKEDIVEDNNELVETKKSTKRKSKKKEDAE